MKRAFAMALLLGLGLGACQGVGGPTTASSVQVSFATRPAGVPLASQTGFVSDTQMVGGNTLIITKVEIVLRQIELRRADATSCGASGVDDDSCQEFEIGPVLVDLPLDPGARQAFQADVPEGTYSQVEFEIHKPDDGDPADQAFVQQHPDFERISIRVTGTFNDTAFVHTTDLDVEQELTLLPNLVVAEGVSTNLTIFADISAWYLVGGVLVNPATANKGEPNESEINNNIKDSFRAFEDADRSGSDD